MHDNMSNYLINVKQYYVNANCVCVLCKSWWVMHIPFSQITNIVANNYYIYIN